ncbi:hypothetical protein ACIRP0_36645 [Streptomyces sp. NPDC101733]|uniref:hypothetical protein n=1 Tax=unclassified Streptomyces TaxID=2593676 RepID=UPI003441094C
MVWVSPSGARAVGTAGRWRRPGRDLAPGSEVVGAWQLLTVWALLTALRVGPIGSLVAVGAGAVACVAVGFLHGLLLVKPLAVLGRWTARWSAWPEPVAVGVPLAVVSVVPAVLLRWWLGERAAAVPGFGLVWAACVASAVLPLLAGAYLRARPVPARVLWVRGAVATGAALAVAAPAVLVWGVAV